MRVRRLHGLACVLAFGLSMTAGTAADDGWKFLWKDGFRLTSPDGQHELAFGGRLQADLTVADADEALEQAVGPFIDGNEFRRARIYFKGRIYERVRFKVQYDFAGGDADFKDVYLEITKTPLGNLRIVHFKEPFSLEELTSSNDIAFLERSLNNVFAPSRNFGLMLSGHRGPRMTWAAGVFRESDGFGTASGSGRTNITGRITWLPVYEDGGRRLIHVGLGATRKDLGDDPFRFRQRPEDHQVPRIADTGSFLADSTRMLDLELAAVSGRLWAAAEWTVAKTDNARAFDGTPLGDPTLSGGYVQVGWSVTGETRAYKTSSGVFRRIRPRHDLGSEGWGALELMVRYSTLDLSDEGLAGGEVDNLSAGAIWTLNPATRMMFDVVHSDRQDVGAVDMLLMRAQLVF